MHSWNSYGLLTDPLIAFLIDAWSNIIFLETIDDFTSVFQKMSSRCHSPSSKVFFGFTFNSSVPDPKSISIRGIPRSSSTEMKSVESRLIVDEPIIDYLIRHAFSYSRRGISMLPETIISSASGGTIGPLYSNNPSDFLVINSKLKWLLSHISNAGYHAQPLPRKLLAVCWHLGPL